MSLSEIYGESERVVWVHLLSGTALSAHHYAMCSQLLQGSSLFHFSSLCFVVTEDCLVLPCLAEYLADLLVEYHANGGGGSWHANRRTSEQLNFEGSWILLLNNNSRKLVPITDCSVSKWVAQPSRRCPYCPEFVSVYSVAMVTVAIVVISTDGEQE